MAVCNNGEASMPVKKPLTALKPTRQQVASVRAIVTWYLDLYHGTRHDPGLLSMFCDPKRVGAFAVTPAELRREDPNALFRMLVAATMFQRRQDVQIMRVLRGLSTEDVAEIGKPKRLLTMVDSTACQHLKSNQALRTGCDLSKHHVTRQGQCSANPNVQCHLKRHTVLLRRYGHFGKVPTSAALALREAGAASLGELRRKILRSAVDPGERSRLLEEELCRMWRVSDKIAAMFLSALMAPDLCSVRPPWKGGTEWTHFVVVDSNVDLLLGALKYAGSSSYAARRAFVRELSSRIELDELRPGLTAFNPRLVQQAMYLFMSSANRRAAKIDCMHEGPEACARCPRTLSRLCPVRQTS